MQRERSLNKYPSLSHRLITCTVTPDDASEPTPTFYVEGDKLLTQTLARKEADESPRFQASQKGELDGLLS